MFIELRNVVVKFNDTSLNPFQAFLEAESEKKPTCNMRRRRRLAHDVDNNNVGKAITAIIESPNKDIDHLATK